jgi:hypothetical protein
MTTPGGAGTFWKAHIPRARRAGFYRVRLVNPRDGPLGEHPGWNGVALPGLQGAGYSPLLAPLLHGGGLLSAVRPSGWSRDDDGGDVLVRMALQPHRRQRAPGRHGALCAARRSSYPRPASTTSKIDALVSLA